MANSVDPDQTAPLGAVWSGSALFAQVYLSENLGSLRYARNDYHKLTATGSTATITALKTRHCIREITGIPSPRAPTLYRPNITGPTYDKNEPCHVIMVLFILRKFILQTCMRSHPVGLDVWYLVCLYVYFYTPVHHVCEQWRLWQDWANASHMSLHWSPMW